MKILIRNAAHEFLTSEGTWTCDEARALAFTSSIEVLYYQPARHLRNVVLAYRFAANSRYDFDLPLPQRMNKLENAP